MIVLSLFLSIIIVGCLIILYIDSDRLEYTKKISAFFLGSCSFALGTIITEINHSHQLSESITVDTIQVYTAQGDTLIFKSVKDFTDFYK